MLSLKNPLELHRINPRAFVSKQLGANLLGCSERYLSPPPLVRELQAVILIPYNENGEKFVGVNIIPTGSPKSVLTLCTTYYWGAGARKTRIISNKAGRAEINYKLLTGEKIRVVNNNNFPVYCVLVFAP